MLILNCRPGRDNDRIHVGYSTVVSFLKWHDLGGCVFDIDGNNHHLRSGDRVALGAGAVLHILNYCSDGSVRVGIDAPRDVRIMREKLIKQERKV